MLYIWCQVQLFKSHPLNTVPDSTLHTAHYEWWEGAADVEHAAADPPPGAQQAGRTQSWSTPQDGTGNNYCKIMLVGKSIFHPTRRLLLSPTRLTSGRWGSCWSRSRSWAPSWPISAASWTRPGAWCGCRRGTGPGCGSCSGCAPSTATPAIEGSAPSTRATRRGAARTRRGQRRNLPGVLQINLFIQ